MANKLILKKSSVAAKVPLATDLEVGELAVNLVDKKLYSKNAGGTVVNVGNVVDSVAGKTGVVTLVKGDVGLGNVDNTSDASKPVSTAQQTALNLKANLASPTFTGTPAAPTAAVGTNTTQVATTAYVNAEIANDAPTKTGGGASGTWDISVTGNAGTATSATTATNLSGGTVDATTISATTSILPAADNTGVVGTVAATWSNGQFTNLSIDGTLTVRAAIDLADSDVLRMGSSDDWALWYNGTTNKAQIEMEAACLGIQFTDNGTQKGYFEKSTGAFTAGSFIGDGSGLTGISAASAGGAIYENSQEITANYTLTAGKNGMSAGDITIASGVTVTIPSGSKWVIV